MPRPDDGDGSGSHCATQRARHSTLASLRDLWTPSPRLIGGNLYWDSRVFPDRISGGGIPPKVFHAAQENELMPYAPRARPAP